MKFLISLLTIIIHFTFSFGQNESVPDLNCYTIIVGKDASADGSVLLAHNEDDPGELLIDIHKTERGFIDTLNEINKSHFIKNIDETFRCLWIEIPGQQYADGFLNEFGVAICSDGSQSKESNKTGEVGYYLRKTLAERAKSAREAVNLAGKIIKQYGYSYSGRTYCIADPDEAWILEVVKGKHWIARRLPDDEIAVIPNYYVIQEVDLSDTVNYLGSPDLINYAAANGWYDPGEENKFIFRSAYGDSLRQHSIRNIARKWIVLNHFSEKQYAVNAELPFSFKPENQVTVKELFQVLRNHYEGTEFEMRSDNNGGNPHANKILTICSEYNQYSFIVQLRSRMPNEVGNLIWFAPRRPCIQPYIPIYFGVKRIPGRFEKESFDKASANHFNDERDLRYLFPNHASWVFSKYAEIIDDNYMAEIKKIRRYCEKSEKKLLGRQTSFERRVLKIYNKDSAAAREILTIYTSKYLMKILKRSGNKINNYNKKK
jgi:dipeptidase